METFNQFVELLQLRNWYALAALLLTLSIQYIKKNPGVPLAKYVTGLANRVWNATPDGWRWTWPVLGGAVTAFIAAMEAGQPGPQALLASLGGAIAIGFGAMGLNAFLTEAPVRWNGGAGGKPTTKPPSLPTALRGVGAAIVLVFLLVGCAPMRDVVWPAVVKCSPPPTQVVTDVWNVLKTDPGGTLSERGLNLLEQLAKRYGPSVVTCAVNSIADRMATDPADVESARVNSKARDFLERSNIIVGEPPDLAAPAPQPCGAQ